MDLEQRVTELECRARRYRNAGDAGGGRLCRRIDRYSTHDNPSQ
jgi:hypothetical protein